jgi:hypothetical protein
MLGHFCSENTGSSIPIDLESFGGWDVDLVEYLETDSSVPQYLLHGHVIDAEWLSSFDVRNSLVKRESFRIERYQEVADRPVFDIFVQNDLISKDYHLKLSFGY